MAITPSTVVLHHKRHTETDSETSVNFLEPFSYDDPSENRSLIIVDKPNWAVIFRHPGGSGATIRKTSHAANNLSTGTHTVKVTFILRIQGTGYLDGEYDYEVNLGSFDLKIIVAETQLLELTPTTAIFEYELQGAQPAQQQINVLSEGRWNVTKTKNWVNLSAVSGLNNGSFYIGVVPSGLAVGTHTDTITVVDSFISSESEENNLNTKTIAVSLVISEADTVTTFLYVSPSKFNLNYTIGGYLTVKTIEYNASGNWTATASKSWVRLSATSGVGGVGTVQITLQNTSSLSEGVYTAEVTFLLGGLNKKVYLTLNVFDFIVDVLDPNQVYFTKENNLIEISSQQTETHLALSMVANYEGRYFVSKKVLPFYNGSATRRIGDFPHTIIGERPMLPNIHKIGLIAPYDPVKINLTITEEDLLSDMVHQVVPVNGIRFLKGKKPSSNWLTDMPLTRHLTKKGVLTFSVLGNGSFFDSIIFTGAVKKTIIYNRMTEKFLLGTVIVPIIELGSLNVGDTFEVDVDSNKIIVNIIPEGNDHCSVFWETNNGVWDVAEFTGDIIETHKPKSSSFEFVKDHNTTETKVIASSTSILYKINTGWIYNIDDVFGLSKLLQATNIYIQFKEKIVKVNPKTKSLKFPKKGDSSVSYDLIFENVEK